MDLVTVVILGLAAYRLTRLIVIDSLFESPKTWLLNRTNRLLNPVNYVLNCTWCMGIWVTASLYAFWLATWPWDWNRADWVVVLAAAGLQGMTHALEPE